jgi:diguanylate cyclase (GGDEF)-like protein
VDGDGHIVVVNRVLRTLLSRSGEPLVGGLVSSLFDTPAEYERFTRELERAPVVRDLSVGLRAAGGERLECAVSAAVWKNAEGDEAGYQLIIRNNEERKAAEEQLHHNALHDALTGLPNRSLFRSRLDLCVRQARRKGEHRFAVLFLDLDRFKVVNDSLGHLVGDRLLTEIARRLTGCVREIDTVARLGGDEFAVLLDEVADVSDATRVAERIQEALRSPAQVDGYELFSSASIGIAFSSTGYTAPEEILRDADIAMYRAKALGRARYELFDEGMHAQVVEVLRLETDLRRALERGEFAVHYQPVVSVGRSALTGFEALLRWNHPERGLLGPDAFLAVAEETGLIVPIGWWLMEEACRTIREWQSKFPADPPLAVSVNLSGKQLAQPDLVERIERTLGIHKLSGSSLRFEVTESVLMRDADAGIRTLGRLKSLGVHLSIDDFGTGYSSLAYLHRFPFDTVKIDGTFIRGLDDPEPNQDLVESIIALAHSLGMDVIGEGVETAHQLDELKALRCEYAQGFVFSRAVDERGASKMLDAAQAG